MTALGNVLSSILLLEAKLRKPFSSVHWNKVDTLNMNLYCIYAYSQGAGNQMEECDMLIDIFQHYNAVLEEDIKSILFT